MKGYWVKITNQCPECGKETLEGFIRTAGVYLSGIQAVQCNECSYSQNYRVFDSNGEGN